MTYDMLLPSILTVLPQSSNLRLNYTFTLLETITAL